jgi:hypothetical protein
MLVVGVAEAGEFPETYHQAPAPNADTKTMTDAATNAADLFG